MNPDSKPSSTVSAVGIVAIGRNEGDRLKRSLASLAVSGCPIVYVDSGSTDGSVALAGSMGASVVELDLSVPFTAARARNAGRERLREIAPDAGYVQFLDGDCELDAKWIETAKTFLDSQAEMAVACGRRRERFPEESVYNKLCDIEWDTSAGPAKSCGGDAMIRLSAFDQVHGFDESFIAGEEPEMCVRLRQAGWAIQRLDAEMTLHDAAMLTFGQFWKRFVRSGYAYAAGAAAHGKPPERHWVRESRSIWLWGLAWPMFIVIAAIATRGIAAILLGSYLLLGWRVYRSTVRRGYSTADARMYAFFCTIGKLPQAIGQAQFWYRRLAGIRGTLIEYKSAAVPVSAATAESH